MFYYLPISHSWIIEKEKNTKLFLLYPPTAYCWPKYWCPLTYKLAPKNYEKINTSLLKTPSHGP